MKKQNPWQKGFIEKSFRPLHKRKSRKWLRVLVAAIAITAPIVAWVLLAL